jgi:hypothetical protein
MLRTAKTIERFELRARDGKIGHVRDFYFDDRAWAVRYLVVETGTWLNSREVLISPVSIGVVDWQNHLLPVELTVDQVRHAPAIDTQRPVTPEQELQLTAYYNWPTYWGAAGFPDVGFAPLMMPLPPAAYAPPNRKRAGALVEEHHLRSVRDVTGYPLEAVDGAIGHVTDFLIDDCTWQIRYLVADTGTWWPDKKIIVAPQWIEEVGWDERCVYVELTRRAIETSPRYDPSEALTPDYTLRLHDHYGRPPPADPE